MSFDDPFSTLQPTLEKKEAPRSKSKKDKFDAPLVVSRREVYQATGTGQSAMHGTQYQLTTRVSFELLDLLKEWAAKLGVTQQDLQRYCFYRGIQSLEEGERPEFEEVVVTKKLKQPR